MIIGLCGYARSGKDTIADILVKNYGFKKVAFADKLREALYQLNPLVRYEGPYDEFHRGDWRVQDVIERFGWDGYKETGFGTEIRYLLQRLGTEAGRQTLGDNIWVDALDWHAAKDIVIPDMRFPNEAQAVESRGGFTWRVIRRGVRPVNAHASETALDAYLTNLVIMNDDTIEDLEITVQEKFMIFVEYGSEARAL